MQDNEKISLFCAIFKLSMCVWKSKKVYRFNCLFAEVFSFALCSFNVEL